MWVSTQGKTGFTPYKDKMQAVVVISHNYLLLFLLIAYRARNIKKGEVDLVRGFNSEMNYLPE